MAFTPISNTVPQYEENGVAASGYFIKFYESGTTTPTAMATDSTGVTLLDKCQLDTEGYPINGSGAVFIPHINVEYKIALFRNAADADANDLNNAAWDVDGLFPYFTDSSIGTDFDQIPLNADIVYPVDTIADLRVLEPVVDGQQISLLGHTIVGVGGGAFCYDASDTASTDNNGTVIVTVGGKRWKRLEDGNTSASNFGLLPSSVATGSMAINAALEVYTTVTIPEGLFIISERIELPLNSSLVGVSSTATVLEATSAMTDSIFIRYGAAYSYGGYRGSVQKLRLKSDTPSTNRTLGLYLNSGIKLYDVTFEELKVAILKPDNQYMDNITIDRCFIAYCGGHGLYNVVELVGNMDLFSIKGTHLVQAYTAGNYLERSGMRIELCNGGSMQDCVINGPISLDRCTAFAIKNHHFEGSQAVGYKENQASLKISRSNVSVEDAYMHPRVNGPTIEITANAGDTHDGAMVSLKNVSFTATESQLSGLSVGIPALISRDNLTGLTLENVQYREDYSQNWTTTFESTGVTIEGNDYFNEHSSVLSRNCVMLPDGTVSSPRIDIPSTGLVNDANMFQFSAANSNIPWYELGDSNATYWITAVLVYDEARQLAAIKNTAPQQITGVTTTEAGITGAGILVRNTNTLAQDGKGLVMHYYRGSASGSYDSIAKIPMQNGRFFFDHGTNVFGQPVVARTAADIDDFTYVDGYTETNGGLNVSFTYPAPPVGGAFVKGDRTINSNIIIGSVIYWVFDGSAWIAGPVL